MRHTKMCARCRRVKSVYDIADKVNMVCYSCIAYNTRLCTKCKESKPVEDFPTDPTLPKTWCNPCILAFQAKINARKQRRAAHAREKYYAEKAAEAEHKDPIEEQTVEVLRVRGEMPKYDWLTPVRFPPSSGEGQWPEGETTFNMPGLVPFAGEGSVPTSRLSGLKVWMDAICVPNWNKDLTVVPDRTAAEASQSVA